jgi:hypothetical protein
LEYDLYVKDENDDGDFKDTDEWEEYSGSWPDDFSFVHTVAEPSDKEDTSTASTAWKSISEVEYRNVPVGIRKIWAYAYTSTITDVSDTTLSDEVIDDAEWYSTVQTIEVKPGHNVVTLYLTEQGF